MSTRSATLAAAAVAGILCVGYAADARAALDDATLETAATPQIADVAVEMALVLEALDVAAEEGDVVAALREHITASAYADDVVVGALELMLEGEWSDTERAAIASLFASYAEALRTAEDDDELAAEENARTDQDLASKLATIANGNTFLFSPGGGDVGAPIDDAPAAPTAPADDGGTPSVGPVGVDDNPPPAPPVGGGSDYDT